MSKPLTRYFKHEAQCYCDCLNKIYWKLPIPMGWTLTRFRDIIIGEATDRLCMNGNPYAITWSEQSERFILFKPKPTPNHIKRVCSK